MSGLKGNRGQVAATLFLILGAGLGSKALAQIQNPGFEDPVPFNGWSTAGDDQIQGSTFGDTPTEGFQQALLATFTNASGYVSGGSGVGEPAMESSLGLPEASLSLFSGSGILSGSVISQSVYLVAGDKVSFDWDFLTNQTYNDGTSDSIAPSAATNDFSFFDVVRQGGSAKIFNLADTFYGYQSDPSAPGGFDTGLSITDPANPFISETGYQTFTWTVGATGAYQIGAGVAHVTLGNTPDDGVNSGLLLDNFQIQAVPEPSPFAALAVVSLAALRRRRKS